MAFRAASLARSLTGQISRTHRHLPLRTFSRSSILHDNLVSDAVKTGDQLAASAPKKRTRSKKIKVEEVKPIDDAAAGVVQAGDQHKVTPPQEESLTKVAAAPIDDLVAQAVQIDNQLAEKPPTGPGRGRKKIEPEAIEEGTLELPPLSEWPRYFPSSFAVKTRASIMNQEHAKKVAEAFVPAGSKGKVIVEAFPGPGVLTRALLNLPKSRIKKIIVLEDEERYLSYLRPLEAFDPRVTVLPLSGFMWDTYEEISVKGLLSDIKKEAWSLEHPRLQFISHIPTKVHGEQLVSQFFRSIPDQQWFFKFGRVPFSLVMTESLWERISAPLGGSARCKLSVIAEATSHFDYAIDPSYLKPYKENFHPTHMLTPPEFVAINIMPLREQWIEKGLLDEWDYCLRRLFVQKAQPLKKCIPQLAPGALSILNKVADTNLPLEERVARRQAPRKMTPREWRNLVNAFVEWPFKPDDLSIDFNMITVKQSNRLE